MNLSSHSTAELKAKHTRLLSAACKVWAEIQRREGTTNIEDQINCLPKKQRQFLLALWKAPHKRMNITDLAQIVWNETDDPTTQVKPETIRKFIQRLESSIEELKIPLFVDCVKRKNGDIYGYKLSRKIKC